MDRRAFIGRGLLGAAGFSVTAMTAARSARADETPIGKESVARSLRAEDVRRHLVGLGAKWIHPRHTVDTFKAGDPQTVVQGIAVAWMGYASTMRQARERGCNLLVVHEPIYYNHRDDPPPDAPAVREKKRFLKESGLVVLRCHDVWDRVPKIGIRDAWAEFLGLGDDVQPLPARKPGDPAPFCGVYEIEPVAASEFARQVAGRVATLGQTDVQFVGPTDKTIRRVAVGTGAVTPFRQMVFDLKADLVVVTDDGFTFWSDGALAIDMGFPVVVTHHGCSEEVGMKRCAEHLAKTFPDVPVHHIAQKCMYQSVQKGDMNAST